MDVPPNYHFGCQHSPRAISPTRPCPIVCTDPSLREVPVCHPEGSFALFGKERWNPKPAPTGPPDITGSERHCRVAGRRPREYAAIVVAKFVRGSLRGGPPDPLGDGPPASLLERPAEGPENKQVLPGVLEPRGRRRGPWSRRGQCWETCMEVGPSRSGRLRPVRLGTRRTTGREDVGADIGRGKNCEAQFGIGNACETNVMVPWSLFGVRSLARGALMNTRTSHR